MTTRGSLFGRVAAAVAVAALITSSTAAAATSVTAFDRFAYADKITPTDAAKFQFVILGYGSGVQSQAWVRSLIASIRATAPQTRLLLYKDYTAAPGDPQGIQGCAKWNTSLPHGGIPLSWFLLDQGGNPVFNGQYSVYELDPSNPQVQQACLTIAVSMAKLGGYDGVFWDSINTSLFWAQLSPRTCSSAACQSNANWQAGMTSYVTNLSAGLHANGLLSFGNIGGANSGPQLGGGPAWWSGLQQAGLDGAAEESFTSGTNRLPIPTANWKIELANEVWSEANGKYLLANADVGGNRALNVYGLATMLLAAGGYSSWDADSGNYYATEYWFSEYDTALALGAPLGPYSVQANGLYVRGFQNGSVVVNPNTTPVSDPVYGNVAAQTGLILGSGSPGSGSGSPGSGSGSPGSGSGSPGSGVGRRRHHGHRREHHAGRRSAHTFRVNTLRPA